MLTRKKVGNSLLADRLFRCSSQKHDSPLNLCGGCWLATPDNLELVVFVGLKLVHHLEKNGHPPGDRFSLESVSSAGNTDCESVCIHCNRN